MAASDVTTGGAVMPFPNGADDGDNVRLSTAGAHVGGLLRLLNDQNEAVKAIAIQGLLKFVDVSWHEIADSLPTIETLATESTFKERERAALLASKLFFYLEMMNEAVEYALIAGDVLDVLDSSDFGKTVLAMAVHQYCTCRSDVFVTITTTTAKDEERNSTMAEARIFAYSRLRHGTAKNRLEELFERLVAVAANPSANIDDQKAAVGVCLEARRLDLLDSILNRTTNFTELAKYILYCVETFVRSNYLEELLWRLLWKAYAQCLPPNRFPSERITNYRSAHAFLLGEGANIARALCLSNDGTKLTDILMLLIESSGNVVPPSTNKNTKAPTESTTTTTNTAAPQTSGNADTGTSTVVANGGGDTAAAAAAAADGTTTTTTTSAAAGGSGGGAAGCGLEDEEDVAVEGSEKKSKSSDGGEGSSEDELNNSEDAELLAYQIALDIVAFESQQLNRQILAYLRNRVPTPELILSKMTKKQSNNNSDNESNGNNNNNSEKHSSATTSTSNNVTDGSAPAESSSSNNNNDGSDPPQQPPLPADGSGSAIPTAQDAAKDFKEWLTGESADKNNDSTKHDERKSLLADDSLAKETDDAAAAAAAAAAVVGNAEQQAIETKHSEVPEHAPTSPKDTDHTGGGADDFDGDEKTALLSGTTVDHNQPSTTTAAAPAAAASSSSSSSPSSSSSASSSSADAGQASLSSASSEDEYDLMSMEQLQSRLEVAQKVQKLQRILSGELCLQLNVCFLHSKNHCDLNLLERIKNCLDNRSSLHMTAMELCHGYMMAGTTSDAFIRHNLDWLSRATCWSKFTAAASAGCLHLGHFGAARRVLGAYLPGNGGGPYSEGGSLYAMGIILANNYREEEVNFVKENLLRAEQVCPQNFEPLQQGGCLGLGLMAMGTGDRSLIAVMRDLLLVDSAVSGEAAALGIGMVGMGMMDRALVAELLEVARESEHEKIIRAASLAVALVLYRAEEEAENVLAEMCADKTEMVRYGAMMATGLAYCGTSSAVAIRRLLHGGVTDLSSSVRRAAVMALGFVLCKAPTELPKVVSLLTDSFDPHVRYGAAMALGMGCASTWDSGVTSTLLHMTNDGCDFVRQAAFMALGLVLCQAHPNALSDGKVKTVRDLFMSTVSKKHENALARFGVVVAMGLIDVSGKNGIFSFSSFTNSVHGNRLSAAAATAAAHAAAATNDRGTGSGGRASSSSTSGDFFSGGAAGFRGNEAFCGALRPESVVGFFLFSQLWYWHALALAVVLATSPAGLIGVNKELRVPHDFTVGCRTSAVERYGYTETASSRRLEPRKGVVTALLTSTQRKNREKLRRLMSDSGPTRPGQQQPQQHPQQPTPSSSSVPGAAAPSTSATAAASSAAPAAGRSPTTGSAGPSRAAAPGAAAATSTVAEATTAATAYPPVGTDISSGSGGASVVGVTMLANPIRVLPAMRPHLRVNMPSNGGSEWVMLDPERRCGYCMLKSKNKKEEENGKTES